MRDRLTYANALATLAAVMALVALVLAATNSRESPSTHSSQGTPAEGVAGSARPGARVLAAGASESGEYDERTNSSKETGYIDDAVNFPIQLPGRLQPSQVIYSSVKTGPKPECSGPGHAQPGYLCIYSDHNGGFKEPEVFNYAAGHYVEGASRYGFDMEWYTAAADTFDSGTWTVTAE